METTTQTAREKYSQELADVAKALASNIKKLMHHEGKVYGNIIDGGQLRLSEHLITVNLGLSEREDPTKLESVDAYLANNLLVNLVTEFQEFKKIKDWRNLTRDNIPLNLVETLHMVAHRRTFFENCEVFRSWKSDTGCNSPADALNKFLCIAPSEDTRDFYNCYLSKSLPILGLNPTQEEIRTYRDRRDCSPGGKHAYHRALRAFYNWLYSPASGYPAFKPEDNPMRFLKAPKVPKRKMPSQNEESVKILLSLAENIRDKAIISTLIDSSGRRSEITNIHESDILWDRHVIKAIAKGNREVLMPIGSLTERLLTKWLEEYHPDKDSNIWGISEDGIVSVLRRLEKRSGIKCNAHTFRRGFAAIQRRKGVDTLDIKDLGHWESYRMVELYTKDVDFEDAQKHYKAPTERLADATDGLQKSGVVPRPRIELGTRGFSVRCSTS